MSSDRSDIERVQLHGKIDDVLRQQRELLSRVQNGQAHFKQLAKSVWQVQEEEQRKIARELHDSVKQQLFSISLSAGAALNLLTTDPEASRCHLRPLHVLRQIRSKSRVAVEPYQ